MSTALANTRGATRFDTTILLVDDHDANLLALDAVLSPLGHRLVQVRSGEEALGCVLQQDFAVILLDVLMPGLDGFQTASIIRARERSRVTPIIFVSALDRTPSEVIGSYADGAVDYVLKPFDPDVLRVKVEAFVELCRVPDKIRGEAVLRAYPPTRKRVLVVEDDDATARLVKIGLEVHGFEVALAHNGPVALQVAKSFQPDVCLVDINLPIMNGYQLVSRMRELFVGGSRAVSFIAVTGQADTDRQVSLDAGFVRHVLKPVHAAQLAGLIESLFVR